MEGVRYNCKYCFGMPAMFGGGGTAKPMAQEILRVAPGVFNAITYSHFA